MRKLIPLSGWLVALTLLLAPTVSAQGWSMTTWFIQTIAIQHNRLDRIKAAQPDPPLRGYIDAVWQTSHPTTNESQLRILGWGFECGALDVTTIDLHLAGFIKDVTAFNAPHLRMDVVTNPGLAAWCPNGIPADSGFDITAPLGQLLPNTYDIKLRLWTADGQFHDTNVVRLWLG